MRVEHYIFTMTDRDNKIKNETWQEVLRNSLRIVVPTESDVRSFGDLLKKLNR